MWIALSLLTQHDVVVYLHKRQSSQPASQPVSQTKRREKRILVGHVLLPAIRCESELWNNAFPISL